jgi:hypothetical protein
VKVIGTMEKNGNVKVDYFLTFCRSENYTALIYCIADVVGTDRRKAASKWNFELKESLSFGIKMD